MENAGGEIPGARTATGDERSKVLNTATLAFATDPVMRWLFPEAHHFIEHFPGLLDRYCGSAVPSGTTFVTNDLSGVAMWMAPGETPDEEVMGAFIAENIRPEIHEDFFTLLGEMDSYHPHDEPCWYLAAIGVDAAKQGRGLGSVLMKHATAMLDAAGMLGYLESSNPANISLYQRHGFEIIGEIRAGTAPLVTPMIRHPQSR
jgi:ribosomal protein S18 acetylase RimI-like enzyme